MKNILSLLIICTLFILSCESEDIHSIATSGIRAGLTAAPEESYITYDGTRYSTIPDSSLFDFTDFLTVEFWVYIDNSTNNQQLVGSWSPNNSEKEFRVFFYVGTPDQIIFQVSNGSEYEDVSYDISAIGFGKWFHIAATFENGYKRLYINGQYVASANPVNVYTLSNGALDFFIGNYDTTTNTYIFNGSMDELRIWNYCRTAKEIGIYYDAKVESNEPGLILYMDFNEGSGSSITDSVNGLTATTYDLIPSVYVPLWEMW